MILKEGYGDPTLATEDSLRVQEGPTVEGIARDLKAMGIRRVQGDIVVDAGAFAGDPYGAGWAWDDESGYYQPQIVALAVNRGTVRLDYLPGEEPGDPIQLRLTPETEYVEVINEAVTGPADSDDTLRIRRERGTEPDPGHRESPPGFRRGLFPDTGGRAVAVHGAGVEGGPGAGGDHLQPRQSGEGGEEAGRCQADGDVPIPAALGSDSLHEQGE